MIHSFKEPKEEDFAAENRRQEEAVMATLRTMNEKRKEMAIGEGSHAFVKIKETVSICN